MVEVSFVQLRISGKTWRRSPPKVPVVPTTAEMFLLADNFRVMHQMKSFVREHFGEYSRSGSSLGKEASLSTATFGRRDWNIVNSAKVVTGGGAYVSETRIASHS